MFFMGVDGPTGVEGMDARNNLFGRAKYKGLTVFQWGFLLFVLYLYC